MNQKVSLHEFDRNFFSKYQYVAGLDEAGRGAWAGPVVTAAVIFSPDVVISGVNDSKKLTAKKREVLFDEIVSRCTTYGVGMIDSVEIDQINILEATKKAMLLAIQSLSQRPDFLLVDGNMRLNTEIAQEAIIDGDALSHSIAAASIIAKVTRDRLMNSVAGEFPGYGFEKHKGYGTKIHQEALRLNGILPIHRKSYGPIREIITLKIDPEK